MILKYGTYPHGNNECSVTIARESWRDDSGERRGYTERWNIEGMLLGAGADLVADLTTKINALEAAYDDDDLDLVLYESDGSTETGHTLKTADTIGGTIVVSGPSFPSGKGAEYATYRKYTITVEAKVEDTTNDTIAFVESVSTAGTGASRFVIHTPLIGSPQMQITAERTPVVVVQEGSAVGKAAYPSVPAPLSLSAEHQDRRRIVRKNAERMPDGSFRNYEISWHYEFSTVSATLTTSPSFDGTGGAGGGVATHYHSGADITSSYVREPYIDPLIARVSDIAAYVGTLRLDGLDDVNIAAVADRDILQYDSGTSKWINTKDGIVLTGNRTPLVDLNPSGAGSACIVDITPSAALGASAHWDGICMDLDALDPSASGALVHAIDVDATGVDLTNDPELHGLHVDLPTTYTGEADKAAGYFSGGGVEAQFCDIELHAANFSQGQVNVDWNAASASAGDLQSLFDARVRTTGSTGGHFHVFDASQYGSGSVSVTLLGTYDTMDIIHQHTGSWTTADKAWKFNGGFTDVTAAFGDPGNDTQIFSSDNDYIYIGHASKFSMLQVILAINSSKNCLLSWSYSDGGAGWPSYSPSDQTHGFQSGGIVVWESSDLGGWSTEIVNGSNKYWIRAQRTRNVLGTQPTEDTIKILEPVVYTWDSSGDLFVHDIVATSLSGTLALTDLGSYARGSLIVGTGADWSTVVKGTAGQILMSDGADLGWTTTFTAAMIFESTVGIGTATVPHGGIGGANLAIEGTNANVGTGPHVQWTTAADNYPLMQFLMWSHDQIQFLYDCYYDGALRSSDVGSNFKLAKASDRFVIAGNAGTAAGAIFTWTNIIEFLVGGNVLIPNSNILFFDVGASAGTEYITSGADGYMDYEATTQHRFNTGDVFVDNDLDVAGQVAIGPNATIAATRLVHIYDASTDTTTGVYYNIFNELFNNAVLTGATNLLANYNELDWRGTLDGNTLNLYGLDSLVRIYGDATSVTGNRFRPITYGAANVVTLTGEHIELAQANTTTTLRTIYAYNNISGTVSSAEWLRARMRFNATANVTTAYGAILDGFFYAGATCTTFYGVRVNVAGVGGPTTAYAFYANLALGTAKWGIYLTGEAQNRMAGKLGIGANPLGNECDVGCLLDGVLALKETTTPTADGTYGKFYTKADNLLYFQSGDGVEHVVAYV